MDWRAALTDLDLDARERALDRFVVRAQDDASLRAQLKIRRREGGELAWTARLAQREMNGDDSNLWFQDKGCMNFRGPVDQQSITDAIDAVRVEVDQVRNKYGFHSRNGAKGEATFLTVTMNERGASVAVTEHVNGKARTSSYSGSDLNSVLLFLPELHRKMLTENQIRPPLRIGFQPGDIRSRFDWNSDPSGGLFQDEELEKLIQEIFNAQETKESLPDL